MENIDGKIRLVLQEGEGQTIEFKENLSNLDKEMVGFVNSMGGSIFVGINDENKIVGVRQDNTTISQIYDIARNCDPPIKIHIEKLQNILEIIVREGEDKPYRCKNGFYLRVGVNSQKLTRDEIISFAIGEGKIRFDEQINKEFIFKTDFSTQYYDSFLKLTNISVKLASKDLLINLNAAEKQRGEILFTNSAVLFFAKDPQKFFPEAYITAVRYRGIDRSSIIDRKDLRGNLIAQVDETMNFVKRNTAEEIIVGPFPQHQTIGEYPLDAIREAVINAATHRDYFYDTSHIYVHIFSDRIEIENPGGLFKGLTIEDLGKHSVRRNRLIAELFFRAGYIEKVGSGMIRMFKAMETAGNPPPEIYATNFFNIIFKKRVLEGDKLKISDRAKNLLHFINTHKSVSREECGNYLGISEDTALRELNSLIDHGLIEKIGTGKTTRYTAKEK